MEVRVTCTEEEGEEGGVGGQDLTVLSTQDLADPADMKDDAGQVSPGLQWPPGCRMKSTLRRSPCKYSNVHVVK